MADFVTVQEVRDAIGIQDLYDDTAIEQVCEAATVLISKQLWYNEFPVVGASIQNEIATLVISAPLGASAGQDITVTNVGSHYNGNHTVIGTYPWTSGSVGFNWWAIYPFIRNNFPNGFSLLQYTASGHPANENYHQILPYGKIQVTPATGVDYAEEAPIRLAALELAIDMWQARQQSNAGGISPDFPSASPYRMGRSLLSRVSGLLAPYLSPRGMVG